jgi:aspartate/tyrosine/aromatic aminotransferase
VTTVLSDPKLRQQWEVDVKEMAERIIKMVSRKSTHTQQTRLQSATRLQMRR